MIEEVPGRSCATGSPTSSSAGRCTTGCRASPGGAAPARGRGAWSRRCRRQGRAAWPTSPTTSRRRPRSTAAAGRRVQPPRRRRRDRRTRLRRGGAPCARRSSWASPTRPPRAEIALELGAAHYRAGRWPSRWRPTARPPRPARRPERPRALRRGPRSASRTPAGGWRCSTRARSSCWRRRWRRSTSRLDDAGAVLSGLGRARASWASRERSAVLRDEAIAMARRMDYRAGLSVVLMRATGRAAPTPDEVLEMLAEARTSPRSWATSSCRRRPASGG